MYVPFYAEVGEPWTFEEILMPAGVYPIFGNWSVAPRS